MFIFYITVTREYEFNYAFFLIQVYLHFDKVVNEQKAFDLGIAIFMLKTILSKKNIHHLNRDGLIKCFICSRVF